MRKETMNLHERFTATLRMGEVDRIPAASPLQTGTVELMETSGAFWPEAFRDPEKMAKLAAAAHEIAGVESVRVPFCVTIEPEAMGAKIGKERGDRQPMVIEPAVKEIEDIDKLEIPDPRKAGRMPVTLKAVEILSKEYRGRVPVICGILVPWFIGYQLRGMEKMLMDIALNPDIPYKILQKTTEAAKEYSRAIADSGADAIALIAAGSSGDILGLDLYTKYAFPYEKDVAVAIKEHGAFSILHTCGDTTLTLDKMAETGVNAISVDQTMDLAWCKRTINGRAVLVGNVDPVVVLLKLAPQAVEEKAKICIEKGTQMLAPGCGFAPKTPIVNMRALVEAAKKYGWRKNRC